METIVDSIAREVSVYFELGTIIEDLAKRDTYEIKAADKDGLLLEHKPHFKGEQKNNLPIGYDELALAFSKGRFFIAGFSSIIEGGNKHNIEKLKRAIKDTRDRIEMEEQTYKNKRLEDEKLRLSLKRRTKRAVRSTRTELEFQTRAELERHQARIAKEEEEYQAKIAHDKKIKILGLERDVQEQRIRFANI
jgi:hypothetical protein